MMPAAETAPKRAAIMQPTFLPWVGYFALMEAVDLFVFLDDVQFDKRSWQQRNRIKTPNGIVWLTVPVLTKGRRDQTIADAEIQPDAKFPDAMWRTIEMNFARAPFADRYLPALHDIMAAHTSLVGELNIAIINWMAHELGIATPTIRSSQSPVSSAKADRLVDLCRAHGVTDYLSPPGSKAYLEDSDAFEKAGIALEYFEYDHPEYTQLHGAFEPYMSALDLLVNAGPEAGTILRSGMKT
ncbi:WbqC family protein [Hyphobacterium sp. HN65]|uniref:WbqC family protein n=1 Tax=Hyphobacterium lacteum TaxID=3116575 RepID=A0ABU7LQL2_9PROT|nr:WbqC family protein [Hyphobacterium sp. HN65]MEE2526205.1 WbqC family protein [Hyphobacterium sp. HN65]